MKMEISYSRIFIICALVLLPINVVAISEYEKNLNELEIAGQDKLFSIVTSPKTAEEAMIALDWLKTRALNGKGGMRYPMAYSFNLWVLSQNKALSENDRAEMSYSSVMWALYEKILSRTDAARCKDKTSYGRKMQGYEQQIQFIIDNYKTLERKKRDELLGYAVKLEEKHKDREPDEWLCHGGMSFFNKYVEKHGKLDGTTIMADGYLGSGEVTLVEDDTIKPEFISDDEWHKTRIETLSKIIPQLRNIN